MFVGAPQLLVLTVTKLLTRTLLYSAATYFQIHISDTYNCITISSQLRISKNLIFLSVFVTGL